MDTTTAAQYAGVSVTTIRTWCRIGAITAIKADGRWDIDPASLDKRIALGIRKPKPKTPRFTPLTRDEYERLVKHPLKDQRCHGEYQLVTRTGADSYGTPAAKLAGPQLAAVRRGAALAAEGYTPPTAKRGPGYAPGLVGDLLGSGSPAAGCHYCGLAPHTCDCI